jgi:hypothetical protein
MDSSHKDFISQNSFLSPLRVSDFDDLVMKTSEDIQELYCRYYSITSRERISELFIRLLEREDPLVAADHSEFVTLFIEYVRFPDLLQVPQRKFFKVCLNKFVELAVTVAEMFKGSCRICKRVPSKVFPTLHELIDIMVCRIIPSSVYFTSRILEILHAELKGRNSSKFKSNLKTVVRTFLEYHKQVLESAIYGSSSSFLKDMQSKAAHNLRIEIFSSERKTSIDNTSKKTTRPPQFSEDLCWSTRRRGVKEKGRRLILLKYQYYQRCYEYCLLMQPFSSILYFSRNGQ